MVKQWNTELLLIMTFKDLVAPRLQGCLTIGLLIISQSVEFGAGSQQLLCCPITVLLQILQAKDLCVQCQCHWSLHSLCPQTIQIWRVVTQLSSCSSQINMYRGSKLCPWGEKEENIYKNLEIIQTQTQNEKMCNKTEKLLICTNQHLWHCTTPLAVACWWR